MIPNGFFGLTLVGLLVAVLPASAAEELGSHGFVNSAGGKIH